ncbi:MAG: DNA mismatch repair endonuclease MutL [Pseudomonadota bacterium]
MSKKKHKNSIKLLSQNTINKIAAGEVIERPASILKELIENSIDAQSKNITVELGNSLPWFLSITDDGIGMNHDDLSLCVKRHATSKLTEEEDLLSLNTLGFRGEALPSIASISKMALESRTRDDLTGRLLRIEGGFEDEIQEVALPYGTKITIKDIFFNTPARQKFLKRYATELNHAIEIFYLTAFIHQNISFKLYKGKQLVYHFSENTSIRERAQNVFGSEFYNNSANLKSENETYRLNGIISSSRYTKSNSKNIIFYVNNRSVRDKTLIHAVTHAYKNFIPYGRYPAVVLSLQCPQDMVDINVHPAKSEVRFVDQSQIYRFVYHAIKDKLEFGEKEHKGTREQEINSKFKIQNSKLTNEISTSNIVSLNSFPSQENLWVKEETGYFESMEVIGQYDASYIVCESSDNKLYLFDQHAMAERVAYEKILESYDAKNVISQKLLFPVSIDLKKGTLSQIEIFFEKFKEIGFEVEAFGEETIIINSHPAIISSSNIESIIIDIIEELLVLGDIRKFDDIIHKLISMLACKASIKAGALMNVEEIKQLLKDVDKLGIGLTCPHGRPFAKEFEKAEVMKWFHRK